MEKIDKILEKIDDPYKILLEIVEKYGCLNNDILDYIVEKKGVFRFTLDGIIDFYPRLKKAMGKDRIEICIGKCQKDKIDLEKLKTEGIKIEERVCLGECRKPNNAKVNDKKINYKDIEDLKNKILDR